MKSSLRSVPSFAFIVFLTCTIAAQDKTSSPAAGFNPAVYRVGERLTYNVNYSSFISAAHIELYVGGRGNYFDRDGLQLKAHVETTGFISAALFSINNDYTTYVSPDSGQPYHAQQVVRASGRPSETAVDFNQSATLDPLPQKPRPNYLAGIYDLLSVLYRVRATPLTGGSSYFAAVRSGGEEYQAEIKVTGKEVVQTSAGSFDAIVTRVNIKNGPDYNLRVYFSDDEWRVPVLVTAKLRDGEIHAELAALKIVPPTGPRQKRTVVEPARSLPTPSPGTDRSPAPLDLPFKVGEQLNFQVYLGNAKQPVASINLAVKSRGRYFNRDGLQFSVVAQTAPTSPFLVRDQMTSYVDPVTLLPFRTEFIFNEIKYRTSRTYNLDQDRGAATSDNNRERIEIPVGTHDLLSALYAIRTFDLSVQRSNAISIMAVNRPRALSIKAERRETLDLDGQKIPAIMLSLRTDDPQPDRLQVRIWVGDDARHLPLRITAVTDVGPVRADLAIVPAGTR